METRGEEEMEIIVLLVAYLVSVIVAWYHCKYTVKQPSGSGIDERAHFRGFG